MRAATARPYSSGCRRGGGLATRPCLRRERRRRARRRRLPALSLHWRHLRLLTALCGHVTVCGGRAVRARGPRRMLAHHRGLGKARVASHARPEHLLARRLRSRHDLLYHHPVDRKHATLSGEPAILGRGGRADEALHGHEAVWHLRDELHRLVHAQQPRQAGRELGDGAEGRGGHEELARERLDEHHFGDAICAGEASREEHHAHGVLELLQGHAAAHLQSVLERLSV
mmetsp:Transcript_27611/g.59446  ORF Transcript_27611/g.59446 Transcript_27611/m.59446 type:complete len:229 (+) Transcript_27611:602-1288(+)